MTAYAELQSFILSFIIIQGSGQRRITKKKNLWPISQTWRGNFFDNGCMIRIMTVEIICPTKLATHWKTLSRKQRSMYNMLNGFKIILTNITLLLSITVAKLLWITFCQSYVIDWFITKTIFPLVSTFTSCVMTVFEHAFV